MSHKEQFFHVEYLPFYIPSLHHFYQGQADSITNTPPLSACPPGFIVR
jgi:hypothetical protein